MKKQRTQKHQRLKHKMRAAVYYNNQDVRIQEMPKPQIGEDEILLKVKASGICGSDVMEWYRIKKAPLVLGHEATGEIAQVGSQVSKYKVGDRVFVAHHVPCNKCRYCLSGNHTVCETLYTTNYFPGGFSEYIRVPKINVERGVFLLPKEISFEEGTFVEPLACVLRGQRVAGFKKGQRVIILGAGISGLLHLLLAKANGAEKITITDINEFRLKKAKELGADNAITAKDNLEELADLVIICTSAQPAFLQALKCVDKAGTILMFAPTEPGVTLSLPVNDFWRQSIKIVHSYGASPDDTTEAVELLRKKCVNVNSLITHKLKLNDAGFGFKLFLSAKDCIKVILEP